MEKTELQKELDTAFNLLSAIPVNGDGVDIMFSAKEHLRLAYKIAADESEKEDG